MSQKRDIPSGPILDVFLGSFKMERPCFKTLSERLTLSFLTKQRYSHSPPPPLSAWPSNLFNWVSSALVTMSATLSGSWIC
uniref:Uncharacterized protein n=1 Tax=Rhizophora mucronata TaxID=61149 RepID=A0A2P2JYJ8_RHIMU